DLLAAGEIAIAEIEHTAGGDLRAGRRGDWNELYRCRFKCRLVEPSDPGRLMPPALRREPKRSGQACDRVRWAVERLQIGDGRGPLGFYVGGLRRGARCRDGKAGRVVTLCRLPSRVMSVACAKARREGQRLRISAIEDQRRHSIDPVGEEPWIARYFG